ncbi:hypothetical protein CKAN_00471200 [Cinnamomum micranthum f. kanehirae]|uniref:Uncharacterized protein n=1 Tax=Cinnamomum micranthum f. kanehirae TaxID=337451 RepID=A0A443NCP8_9MAGN|nr:hypothetical protein CKAN_00471200 [Cinnamomum micranthum f. kanehirae]
MTEIIVCNALIRLVIPAKVLKLQLLLLQDMTLWGKEKKKKEKEKGRKKKKMKCYIVTMDHNAHPVSMQSIPVICSLLKDFKETNLVMPALVKACRKTNKLQNPQRLKGLLMN